MVDGYVVNNTGKHRHIFKCGVPPGMKIKLSYLYSTYKFKYGSDFDLDFVEWLETNKVPSGFEIVVERYEKNKEKNNPIEEYCSEPKKEMAVGSLSSRQIAELKIKDDPKQQIKKVDSVHKLRRALTLCKGKKGRATITKYIKERISELS